MADFEERVTVEASGGDALIRMGADAEGAAKGVGKLKDELGELGGASAGADAAAASLGHVRDEALEAAAAQETLKKAVDSYRDSAGRLRANGKFISESGLKDLLGGGGSGGSGLSRISRDAGDAEKGLRDVERAAGDADKAIGGGGGGGILASLGGGLDGSVENLGQSFSKIQGLGMPALIVGVASAASTIGPALLATGAGIGAWGALAAPAVIKVKDALTSVTAAQQKYDSASALAKADPTSANVKAQATALTALHNAWAVLPPEMSKSVSSIQGVEKAFSKASKPIQQQAMKDLPKLAGDVKGLIPVLSKLAGPGGGLVSSLLGDAGKFEKSKGFDSFISNLKSEMSGAAGPLKNFGGALGAIATSLFSKGNVATGDKLLNSISSMMKSVGPGRVKELGQVAHDLTTLNNAVTQGTKQGGGLQRLARGFDDAMDIPSDLFRLQTFVNGGGFETMLGAPSINGQIQKVGANDPRKGAPANLGQILQQDAAKAVQAGSKGGTSYKIKAEVSGASQAEGELKKLRAYTSKSEKMKIEVTDSGADKAKSDFKGIVTAAKTAGTQAGAAIAPGIQAGAGAAKSAATQVAGGVKSAVAPLPGDLHATGAAAGAGMAAGISSETGAVSAAAAGLAAAAEASAKTSLQISSPSKKFVKIGQQTWQGFVLGLEGGQSQVDAAIKALTGSTPFKDSAITSTVKSIRKEIDLAAKSGKINPLDKMGLTQLLDQDNGRLMTLANKRQTIINKINAAEALAKSVQQAAAQGADLGTIAGSTIQGQQDASAASGAGNIADVPTGPATLQEGLQDQLGDIQKFNSQMKQLKKEGLDKAGLKELANDGVQAGSEAASQILAGGKKGVQAIAKLDNSIGLASKKLGVTAGNAAYEGASQIGDQLAAGLKDSLKAVDKQMASLDKSLMTAIMTALGDSPKDIKAAMAKLDKELGLSSGASGGSSGGKVTPPHIINQPKTNQGRFAQPGPIRASPPHMVQPAFGGSGSQASQPLNITLTSNISVSGRQLAKVVQTKTLQRAASNTSSGLVLPGRTS